MSLIRGLKKLFTKNEPFSPPNEHILTSKERESVIVFFSSILVAAVIVIILFFT